MMKLGANVVQWLAHLSVSVVVTGLITYWSQVNTAYSGPQETVLGS